MFEPTTTRVPNTFGKDYSRPVVVQNGSVIMAVEPNERRSFRRVHLQEPNIRPSAFGSTEVGVRLNWTEIGTDGRGVSAFIRQ